MEEHAQGVNDWPTGFMLLQGNRLETLCGLMTTWMQRHPLHPLENEVILVQSNGIGQWLKLALAADPRNALSGGCGIAAAVDVTLPARFIWRVYRSVLEVLPDSSAFDKAPMTWRLYRLLGDLDALGCGEQPIDADCFAPLRRFLTTDTDARRRYQLAERLADLYDQYQVYRADWLEAWQADDDQLIRADGSRVPVPDEQRWQPALWRGLKRDIAAHIDRQAAETERDPLAA
ncbi:MAG: exodeoxyribonuclease V subunit gamma, partial [Thiohalocapsa sp.]